MTLADCDRYDRDVLERLARLQGPVRTRTLTKLYRKAGVRNPHKAKSRIKDLESGGLIEDAGDWLWEYAGPRQAELEASA